MTKTMPVLGQLSFEDKIHLYSRNGLTAIVFSMLFYSKNLQGSDVLISPAGMSPILIKHNETTNLLFYKHLIKIAEFNLSREEFLILRVLILLHTGSSKNIKMSQNEVVINVSEGEASENDEGPSNPKKIRRSFTITKKLEVVDFAKKNSVFEKGCRK
uniref:Uncharacterized protein n=1 Tax=Meloidogyne enterolobii TaxID=390850 RepID=A0A6V7WYB3_MELEN|nr:unnamed protein product [Meloidogyne enterolobii]